ncbi:MAG: alkaline phosphatase, partial [Dysgonamonadaceae bacterium]|nr:alkaline phosphatase [Dysgonamonadaceae bacterium]
MKKIAFAVFAVWIVGASSAAREKPAPVKNVIVMIPDGTSIGVVSAARWYKLYRGWGEALNMDPYVCGSVKTFCSNAPIGDSAPTMSCYMTGITQRAKNISIYPVPDPKHDLLYSHDGSRAFQPQVTLPEAARIVQNKATGLVFTCEFPHATPAACAAHDPDRNKFDRIALQMAHNGLNVLFGGGNRHLTEDIKAHLNDSQTKLIQKDVKAFRNEETSGNLWALFSDDIIPYDLDRDDAQYPSLEEMTRKAIEILSKAENGFFLMVEGSLVDYAAHSNDAAACLTEFLAFDRAVGAALDFARREGNTAVVVLPDHGNSGFTVGKRGCKASTMTLDDLFKDISRVRKTAYGLAGILQRTSPDSIRTVFHQHTGIDLADNEYRSLLATLHTTEANYMEAGNTLNLSHSIVRIINDRNCFGFTSGSHTGEEVFLAAYHPKGDLPLGVHSNVELHRYLYDIMNLPLSMEALSDSIFAKHTDVFRGLCFEVKDVKPFPVLVVTSGKNTLEI